MSMACLLRAFNHLGMVLYLQTKDNGASLASEVVEDPLRRLSSLLSDLWTGNFTVTREPPVTNRMRRDPCKLVSTCLFALCQMNQARALWSMIFKIQRPGLPLTWRRHAQERGGMGGGVRPPAAFPLPVLLLTGDKRRDDQGYPLISIG